MSVGLRARLLRWCRRNGVHPPQMLLEEDEKFARKVASRLTSNDVVIDLGAHVGIMSREFAHYAGKVYAFEPHPKAFAQLVKNTKNKKNIVPINKAAAGETGMAVLFSAPTRDGKITESSSLSQEKTNISKEHSFSVETVALGDFINSLGTDVAMIKMDVEGAEYDIIDALLGSSAIDRVGVVYVEDHCDRIPGLDARRAASLARIRELGLEHKFDFTWH